MTGQYKFKHFLCPTGLRSFPLSSLVMTVSLLTQLLLLFYTHEEGRSEKVSNHSESCYDNLYSGLSGPKSPKLPGRVSLFLFSLSSQSTQ